MKFTPLQLPGAFLLEREVFTDERGSFARQFCRREMLDHGLDFTVCQCNLSGNTHKGTVRGLHYQKMPFPEPKIVSCLKGKVFDVLVDLRPQSPFYLQHIALELTGADNFSVYVLPLVAHGFQTLQDDTIVYYQLGEFFLPEAYDGVRWNDPKLRIAWPITENIIINQRDNNYALL